MTDSETTTDFRWLATATYRSQNGPIEIDYHIEELGEIEGLIERGPNWNTLIEIKITLNPRRAPRPGSTAENAEKRLYD